MFALGIETSCDETAVGIVKLEGGVGTDVIVGERSVLCNEIFRQYDLHQQYGGVVPEIAARAHVDRLDYIINLALVKSGLTIDAVDLIAAAAGPGLIGGLIVGLTTAKALALVTGKPLIAVNHLEAHALTPRITDRLPFPYLLLLMSGGHTQLLVVKGVGDYLRLGTTLDDALGEVFDKIAKALAIGRPDGAKVEEYARNGDGARFKFPIPLKQRQDCHFSFSGLKTAVIRTIASLDHLRDRDIADVCAGFQYSVAECLKGKVNNGLRQFRAMYPQIQRCKLVIAGGVAANDYLRQHLRQVAAINQADLVAPDPALCTDNGVMIAWAAIEKYAVGYKGDGLDFKPRARWPLDNVSAPVVGYGKLGAKV